MSSHTDNLPQNWMTGEFLTDQELFSELYKLLKDKYSGSKISTLSNAQKLDVARTLHYDYHSSNGQIRRLLGITIDDIDARKICSEICHELFGTPSMNQLDSMQKNQTGQ